MARVIQINYGRTFNNGNFESSKIEVFAELGLNESYEDGFNELQEKINNLRNIELDYTPEEPTTRRRRR